MTPERWAAVKAILARALEEESDRRQAFIDRACGSDELLRKEVHSLLRYEERTNGFLRRPLLHTALGLWKYSSSSVGRYLVPAENQRPSNTAPQGSAESLCRPAFFWFACAMAIVFVMLYAHAVRTIYTHGNAMKEFGWSTQRQARLWIITGVNPTGPAARTVQNGDELMAFNGDPRARVVGAGPYKRYSPPDATYVVRVRRNAQHEHEYTLRVAFTQRSGGARLSAIYLALSIGFCLMAVAMGLLKPRDRLPQLGCVAGLLTALTLLGMALKAYRGLDTGPASVINDAVWLLDPLYLALGYHFFLRLAFPASRPSVWFALRNILYVICGFQTAIAIILGLAGFGGQDVLVGLAYKYPILIDLNLLLLHSAWSIGVLIVAYTATSGVLVRGYRQSNDPDLQRRIAWVVFGGVLGLLPIALYTIVELAFRLMGQWTLIESSRWSAAQHLISISLVALPLTLAYAVVKHRLLNIRVVIRRTLQYLMAARVFQAILLLPILGLLWPLITNPNRSLVELFPPGSWSSTGSLLVALGLSVKYRQALRRWLDRKFFRDLDRQESLLRDLAREIKDLDTAEDVAILAERQLSAALHPSFMSVYCRPNPRSPLVLSHSSGEVSREVHDLTAARLATLGPAEFSSPQELLLPSVIRAEDTAAGLLVPINNSSGQLIGVLLLGGKKSEEPYGATDRELLQAVTDQMAGAYERVWLRERVNEEQRLRHDVLGHLSDGGYDVLLECATCGLCFDAGVQYCIEDSSELTHFLPVERVIGGRYRLDRRLGEGGMGAVYEATDLQLSRRVAAKIMLGRWFGNSSALRRFEREARAVARLNHSNIVAVHDYGRIANDGAYLIMERISGTTWRAELERRGGVLPFGVLAVWLEQLLEGLAAAHAVGVIHRDLKPENVLVTATPSGAASIKIVDFGLAKLAALDGRPLTAITNDGAVIGTLGYMPPEQLMGQPCDERSDVFAVGAMVVEAITGLVPFAGTTVPEILSNIGRQELRLPARLAILSDLADALRIPLQYDASKRYQTVSDMQRQLLKSLCACVSLDSVENLAPLITNKS